MPVCQTPTKRWQISTSHYKENGDMLPLGIFHAAVACCCGGVTISARLLSCRGWSTELHQNTSHQAAMKKGNEAEFSRTYNIGPRDQSIFVPSSVPLLAVQQVLRPNVSTTPYRRYSPPRRMPLLRLIVASANFTHAENLPTSIRQFVLDRSVLSPFIDGSWYNGDWLALMKQAFSRFGDWLSQPRSFPRANIVM